MIDKIKNILTIALVVIIIFAIVYSIVNLTISAFEQPTLLSLEKIEEYKKEAQVITNYSTYYYLNDCLTNFVTACEQDMYAELYNLYIEDYNKQYTKEQVISKLKAIPVRHSTDSIDYETRYNLNTVYDVNNEYLLEIDINDEILYLVFRTDETGKSEYDYRFAFLK